MPRSFSQEQIIKILSSIGLTGTAAAFSAYWTTLLGGHAGARLLQVDIHEKDMIYAMKINAATTTTLGLSIQLFQHTGHLKSFPELLEDAPLSLIINFIITPTILPIVINNLSRKDDIFIESIALICGGMLMQLTALILFLLLLELTIHSSIFKNNIEFVAQKIWGDPPEESATHPSNASLPHSIELERPLTSLDSMINQINKLGMRIQLVMNSMSLKNIRRYIRSKELMILEPVLKVLLRRWHSDHDPLGHYYSVSIASLNFDTVRDIKNLVQWCFDVYRIDPKHLQLDNIHTSLEEILYTHNLRAWQMHNLNEVYGQKLRADALTKLAELTKIPSSLRELPSKPETDDIKTTENPEPALANDKTHTRKKKKKKKKRDVSQNQAKSESPRNSFFQPQQPLLYGNVRIMKRPEKDDDADASENEDEKPDALPLTDSSLYVDEKPLIRPSEPTGDARPSLHITHPTAQRMDTTPVPSPTKQATTSTTNEKTDSPALPATPKMNKESEFIASTVPAGASLPTSKPMLFRSFSAPANKPFPPTPQSTPVPPNPVPLYPPGIPIPVVTQRDEEITEIARVILSAFEKKVFSLLKNLIKTESHPYKIYIVGGWAYDKVREVVLGIAPCLFNDIDLVTDIPEEILLSYKGFHKVPQVNGLFTTKFYDVQLDIIHEADLSNLERNVMSRDFMTFYIDEEGRVFDPTKNALAKLCYRQLCSVHDIQTIFNEDPLVILRAIHLSTKRTLDMNEFKHMILMYKHRLIPNYYDTTPESKKYLHPHRMNLRIRKIFSQQHALQNLTIIKDLGLLEILFPSIYEKMFMYYDWIWAEMTETNKLPWPKIDRIYAIFIASALGEDTFISPLAPFNDTGNDLNIYPQAAAIWQSSILFQDVFESTNMLYEKLRGPLQSYRTFYTNKYAAQLITLPSPSYPVFTYAV